VSAHRLLSAGAAVGLAVGVHVAALHVVERQGWPLLKVFELRPPQP